jgi:hypothetical protein
MDREATGSTIGIQIVAEKIAVKGVSARIIKTMKHLGS